MKVKVTLEIQGDNAAQEIDKFHGWRRMNERPSVRDKYNVKIVDWVMGCK